MILDIQKNIQLLNGKLYFTEEGGNMVSTGYAQIIADAKGDSKKAISLSGFNYKNLNNHAVFELEQGDFIFTAKRTFDKYVYSIYEVDLSDLGLRFSNKISFDEKTVSMILTPKFLNAFKALDEKLKSPYYGPRFFKK